MSDERRVTMPNNALSRAYEKHLGTSARVLPPAPPQSAIEQYEQDWGPESAVEGTTQPPEDGQGRLSPTDPMLSAPPPLTTFIMIDLLRGVAIGDNYEEFPITDIGLKNLMGFCRDVYLETTVSRVVGMSKKHGLPLPQGITDGTTEEVPEVQEDQAPQGVQKARKRKAK